MRLADVEIFLAHLGKNGLEKRIAALELAQSSGRLEAQLVTK